jgi:hypothetical protein
MFLFVYPLAFLNALFIHLYRSPLPLFRSPLLLPLICPALPLICSFLLLIYFFFDLISSDSVSVLLFSLPLLSLLLLLLFYFVCIYYSGDFFNIFHNFADYFFLIDDLFIHLHSFHCSIQHLLIRLR